MTFVLDEIAKGFAPVIAALDDEDRINTQDIETMIEMKHKKTDIAERVGHLLS